MDDTQSGTASDGQSAEQRTSVTIRRAPKFPVFAAVGGLAGFLAAVVLTGLFEVDPAVGAAATLGYLSLYAVPLGMVLAVVVALLLDARASRRATEVIAGKLEVGSDADGDTHDGSREHEGPADDSGQQSSA